jgi:hypothetical protein
MSKKVNLVVASVFTIISLSILVTQLKSTYINPSVQKAAVSTSVTPAFNIGDRVKTLTDTHIRSSAGGRKSIGTQLQGSTGSIIAGPTRTKGSYWWNVDFDAGVDGWVIESTLSGLNQPVNNPPTAYITLPVSGPITIPQGQTTTQVPITVTATDIDGTVTKVDFYQNGNLLGTDIYSPYTYTWVNVGVGSYTLTAKATDNGGSVTTSNSVSISVQSSSAVPNPTLSISASPAAITSGQSSTINWTSSNATSCTATGGWSGSKTVSGSQSVYPTNTTTYTLTCNGASGTTPVTGSATVTVTTGGSQDTTPPESPSSFSVSTLSYKQIKLTWLRSSDPGTYELPSYLIERSSSPTGPWNQIGTTKWNFENNGYIILANDKLQPVTQYCYRISAYDAAGNISTPTPVGCATTLAFTAVPPEIPQQFNTYVDTYQRMQVKWTSWDTDVTFKVERSRAGGEFEEIANINSNTSTYIEGEFVNGSQWSFTDVTAYPDTSYSYRVRASNQYGYSDYTSTKTVTSAPIGTADHSVLGAIKTLAITVSINGSKPISNSTFGNLIFGEINSHISASSYGQARVEGQTVGPFSVTVDLATCKTPTLNEQILSAVRDSGVDTSQYKVFAFSYLCGSTAAGVGANGMLNMGSLDTRVAIHEFGHAIGLLPHASAYYCAPPIPAGECNIAEYGNPYDILGSSSSGQFNMTMKSFLGWMSGGRRQEVTTSGTYQLTPLESNDTGVKDLEIVTYNPNIRRYENYALELRQTLSAPVVLVYFRGYRSSGYMLPELLNTAVLAPVQGSPAGLTAGGTVDDVLRGVKFTVNSVSFSGASIQVTYTGSYTPSLSAPATPANFQLSFPLSPDQPVFSWTDKSDNETQFEIERWPNSAVTTQAVSPTWIIPANTTQFTEPDRLVRGVSYTFRIRAYNNKGYSDSLYFRYRMP